MSDNAQISRPYARAAFDYALENNAIEEWSVMLSLLAELSKVPGYDTFIRLPEVTNSDSVDFILEAVGDKLNEQGKNLVKLLAQNRRLNCLESLSDGFLQLRAEHEKVVSAEVSAFSELSESQKASLVSSLEKKLNKAVSLSFTIDKSLLGGVVIRAGDFVIDGSVRGKLNKLEVELQEP